MKKATDLAPKAFVCVIGNKADLLDNAQVEFKEAHDTCFSLDSHIIYFHLSANETRVVEHCFWDIISRPLIFKHVVSICACVCAHMYGCVCVCVYVCVCASVCTCLCMYACVYVSMRVRVHACVYVIILKYILEHCNTKRSKEISTKCENIFAKFPLGLKCTYIIP